MATWIARRCASLTEASSYARSILSYASMRPDSVYLLIPSCSIEVLGRLDRFSKLPCFKIHGRIRSFSALTKTLSDHTPLELMVSIQDSRKDVDELILLRWSSPGKNSYVNMRWKGVSLASVPLRRWIEHRRPEIDLWTSSQGQQGHLIAHMREQSVEVREELSRLAVQIARSCEELGESLESAVVAWTGSLSGVEDLLGQHVVEHEPSFPGLVGFGPAGEPEDNIDRDQIEGLCSELDAHSALDSYLFWAGIRQSAADSDYTLEARQKYGACSLVVSSGATIPSRLKLEIKQAIAAAGERF